MKINTIERCEKMWQESNQQCEMPKKFNEFHNENFDLIHIYAIEIIRMHEK